jgi:hypothetical protein
LTNTKEAHRKTIVMGFFLCVCKETHSPFKPPAMIPAMYAPEAHLNGTGTSFALSAPPDFFLVALAQIFPIRSSPSAMMMNCAGYQRMK